MDVRVVNVKEVVLPSGRFASVRPITLGDVTAAHAENPYLMLARLAPLTTKIDGSPLTPEMFLEMEMDDFFPIQELLTADIARGLSTKGGIA
jgi:hypothetical protein